MTPAPLCSGTPPSFAERQLDLERRGLEFRRGLAAEGSATATEAAVSLTRIARLLSLERPRAIAVVGCGHRPEILRRALAQGHHAVGVEPVRAYVRSAAEYLQRDDVVLEGAAERLPLAEASQDVVIFENVLEHVDSVQRSLAEIYRVTAPGGVAFVKTNSRLAFSPSGFNAEFQVPFYNWLPPLVKESFVFLHLHVDPSLADFTPRPAVHWFTYSELCAAGREAGFAEFLSLLDVVREDDPPLARSSLRRWAVTLCRHRPWLRALALTQLGGYVYMLKRPGTA